MNVREGPTAVSRLRWEEESKGPKIRGESPSTSGVTTARTHGSLAVDPVLGHDIY